ncbi:MAG: transcription termination/antitermination protein NusG [Candidatus Goldiibacteriota bacterium HGW-Goldbacteria-1]|jgi:transcriptional antiterminator NusG|nr:MAG: transcription termination/antitermination protein NusG [Candidatus Goldiibacteriota bacterium HGW-Goldbacteria-1]
MASRWYFISTYAGQENNVKENMLQRIQTYSLENKITNVLIPSENVTEIKKKKKVVKNRKFFPGYIMIEMDVEVDSEEGKEILYIVRNTPKVTGFVGTKSRPIPLSDSEVTDIMDLMEDRKKKPRMASYFEIGEHIKITDGPFLNFNGIVEEVNPEKGKMKVIVTIFGRPTPVELEFSQVEKIV